MNSKPFSVRAIAHRLSLLAAAAIALSACSKPNPGLSFEAGHDLDEGTLELSIYSAGGARLTVCGQVPTNNRVSIPYACVVPPTMRFPIDGGAPLQEPEVETLPIPMSVIPLFGPAQDKTKTITLEWRDHEAVLELVLYTVTRGKRLVLANGPATRARRGIAFTPSVRAIDGKTLEDIGMVVRVTPVNWKKDVKTCHIGTLTAMLSVHDTDLEAFDASTGQSIGKTHLSAPPPTCPTSHYGYRNEVGSVTTSPGTAEMNSWARSIRPHG